MVRVNFAVVQLYKDSAPVDFNGRTSARANWNCRTSVQKTVPPLLPTGVQVYGRIDTAVLVYKLQRPRWLQRAYMCTGDL